MKSIIQYLFSLFVISIKGPKYGVSDVYLNEKKIYLPGEKVPINLKEKEEKGIIEKYVENDNNLIKLFDAPLGNKPNDELTD